MPCVLICLVYRPIGGIGHCIGIVLQRTPEVSHHAVEVIYRLDTCLCWPSEQYRATSKERLDVILHVAETFPNKRGNLRFSAETTGKVILNQARFHPHRRSAPSVSYPAALPAKPFCFMAAFAEIGVLRRKSVSVLAVGLPRVKRRH